MDWSTPYLHLSDRQVRSLSTLAPGRVLGLCREVFELLASGDYLMGGQHGNSHGLGLVFPPSSPFPNMPTAGPDRRFVTMPAYVGGRFDVCGNKWYGSNNDNLASGLPRSVLTLMLNDKTTGVPLCLMGANAISAARTGAVPAVASAILAPGAETLAMVGCGAVNRAAMHAIAAQQPSLREIRLYDVISENAAALAADACALGARVLVAESADTCVTSADLISIAASRTHPLRLPAEAFAPEATVLLSGPMASDDEFWLESAIVLDHVGLHEEYVREASLSEHPTRVLEGQIGGPLYRLIAGGLLPPLCHWTGLGELLTGSASPPPRDGRRVFVASGMAVFDVALGLDVYHEALERGLGAPLDIWN